MKVEIGAHRIARAEESRASNRYFAPVAESRSRCGLQPRDPMQKLPVDSIRGDDHQFKNVISRDRLIADARPGVTGSPEVGLSTRLEADAVSAPRGRNLNVFSGKGLGRTPCRSIRCIGTRQQRPAGFANVARQPAESRLKKPRRAQCRVPVQCSTR